MTADPFNLSQLDSYRYLEKVSTRYSDQDPMGHINNVAYAAYIEAGRLGYFLNLMAPSGTVDLNYVLANLNIDYRAEMHFPGNIFVGVKILSLGTSSLTTGYGIFKDGTCHATATCVNVNIDIATRKSTPIEIQFKQLLLAEFTAKPNRERDVSQQRSPENLR